jgi:sulfite reductase beta subunit-like hemoprotein
MRPTDADFRAALKGHQDRVERYRRGELTNDQFRPIRLGYGLYYQLDHTSHMQRIKLPGGLLTTEQADAVANIAEEWARGVIHVTTRQDVQLHWIPLEQIIPMYERLHAVGITTRGACADSVRNVTGCFHAGALPDEPFDITPYMYAVHEYFLFHPLNLTLPRKFKIAFASCAADCVQGPVNDIVFYPKRRGDEMGFRVLAGGGLGSQPFLAVPVRDFVAARDVLIAAEAIVRVHHRLGERKNRHKARLKYVVKKLGERQFVAEIEAECARIEAECGALVRRELDEIVAAFALPGPRHAGAPLAEPEDRAAAHWQRTNVWPQAQTGYYGVTVQLPLGDCTSPQMRTLSRLAREHGNGLLRTSNDQNLYLPWIPGDRVPAVYGALREIRLADPDALHITDVTACPGADYCSLAVSRSMGMAAAIRKHLVAQNGGVEALGVFRIKISGCPNACGQHHVGDIGLTGMSLKDKAGGEAPHYSILVGGRVGEDTGALGQRLASRFAEADVPCVIAALAEYYRDHRTTGEPFAVFAQRVGTRPLTEVALAAAAPSR